MVPPASPSLEARSHTKPHKKGELPIGVVLGITVGAFVFVGLFTSFVVWCLWRRKRAQRRRKAGRYGSHKRSVSDVIVSAPLLNNPWPIDEGPGTASTRVRFDTYQEGNQEMREFYGQPLYPSQMQDFEPRVPPAIAPPKRAMVDTCGPTLYRLEIPRSPSPELSPSTIHPARIALSDTATDRPSSPFGATAESASLYSQPSGEDTYYYVAARTTIYSGLPTSEHEETRPTRMSTLDIGRALKDRADRSPKPLSRSSSQIERQGSIRGVLDGAPPPLPSESTSPASPRKKSIRVAPMAPLPEVAPSALLSPAFPNPYDSSHLELLPTPMSFLDMTPSPTSTTPSTTHMLRQFPFPPPASDGSESSTVATDTPSRITVQLEPSMQEVEGESPMVQSMGASRQAEILRTDRYDSVAPSVYLGAPHHKKKRSNTLDDKVSTAPLTVEKRSSRRPPTR